MFHALQRPLLIAVTALFAAGCAGTTPEGALTPGMDEGIIIVDNTGTTLGSATIYLVPETGVQDIIGTVSPNEEERFRVEADAGFRYHLVADLGADELVSREFTFTESMAVEWELDTNIIQLPVR